jgi:protein arginine N-methyltransferase 3
MVSLRIRSRLFLLREPILAEEGTFLIFFMASKLLTFDGVDTIVAGTFYCKKSDTNSRELDAEIHYCSRQNAGTTEVGDTVVQIRKVR